MRSTPANVSATGRSITHSSGDEDWCKLDKSESALVGQKVNTKLNNVKTSTGHLNTLRLRQNGRNFADDTFKCTFMNENVRSLINILLKFVPKGLIYNIPALVQIMAWHWPGAKPLSEPMMVNLLTHICVTQPQWVKVVCYLCKKIPFHPWN